MLVNIEIVTSRNEIIVVSVYIQTIKISVNSEISIEFIMIHLVNSETTIISIKRKHQDNYGK